MNAKQRAVELYQLHIALASTDGRLFRKTVMDTLMAETGCSLAAAATHYNNAKKAAPVEGLGRAPAPAGLKKPGAAPSKQKPGEVCDDNDCFTVIELIPGGAGNFSVGRTQSFLMQGDASEKFDEKVGYWPNNHWVMIQGLGPNHSDSFKLDTGEKEIKRYSPEAA
jgi:hypothetical protein